MMTLNPSEDFPIVRVLQDHTDTGTNYVQCIIRDATTDAIVDTVNLDDLGDRRFKKVWKVIWDNSFARGRYLLFTTTVYSDSGYTVKNPIYSEVGDTYLVQERFNNHAQFGGGGESIDYATLYKEVRKIIKEEMKGIEIPKIEMPDMKPHTKEIMAKMQEIEKKVDTIEMPEMEKPEKIDLTPLDNKMDAVMKETIKEIKALPKFKETDLTPVIQTIIKEVKALKEDILEEIAIETSKTKTFTLQASAQDQTKSKRSMYLKNLASQYGI